MDPKKNTLYTNSFSHPKIPRKIEISRKTTGKILTIGHPWSWKACNVYKVYFHLFLENTQFYQLMKKSVSSNHKSWIYQWNLSHIVRIYLYLSCLKYFNLSVNLLRTKEQMSSLYHQEVWVCVKFKDGKSSEIGPSKEESHIVGILTLSELLSRLQTFAAVG